MENTAIITVNDMIDAGESIQAIRKALGNNVQDYIAEANKSKTVAGARFSVACDVERVNVFCSYGKAVQSKGLSKAKGAKFQNHVPEGADNRFKQNSGLPVTIAKLGERKTMSDTFEAIFIDGSISQNNGKKVAHYLKSLSKKDAKATIEAIALVGLVDWWEQSKDLFNGAGFTGLKSLLEAAQNDWKTPAGVSWSSKDYQTALEALVVSQHIKTDVVAEDFQPSVN